MLVRRGLELVDVGAAIHRGSEHVLVEDEARPRDRGAAGVGDPAAERAALAHDDVRGLGDLTVANEDAGELGAAEVGVGRDQAVALPDGHAAEHEAALLVRARGDVLRAVDVLEEVEGLAAEHGQGDLGTRDRRATSVRDPPGEVAVAGEGRHGRGVGAVDGVRDLGGHVLTVVAGVDGGEVGDLVRRRIGGVLLGLLEGDAAGVVLGGARSVLVQGEEEAASSGGDQEENDEGLHGFGGSREREAPEGGEGRWAPRAGAEGAWESDRTIPPGLVRLGRSFRRRLPGRPEECSGGVWPPECSAPGPRQGSRGVG